MKISFILKIILYLQTSSLDAYDEREIVSRLEFKVGEEMMVAMDAGSPPPYTGYQVGVPEPAEIDPWDILEETDDSPKWRGYFKIFCGMS